MAPLQKTALLDEALVKLHTDTHGKDSTGDRKGRDDSRLNFSRDSSGHAGEIQHGSGEGMRGSGGYCTDSTEDGNELLETVFQGTPPRDTPLRGFIT